MLREKYGSFIYIIEPIWKSEGFSKFDGSIERIKDNFVWEKKYVCTSIRMLWWDDYIFLGMDDYGDIFYGINFASADYLGLCTNE